MKDLQVKYTDPLDLIPYENNPRINDYAVKKVMESIKEYGFTNPIIVDADMVIIAGHTRREASILAGLDRVPYIVRDDLTPEQVKAYRIADNKLAELGDNGSMQNVLGIGVQKIVTDFGEISLVLDRYADTKTILTVDLGEVQIAELRGTFYEDLPKAGDYYKGHVLNESTIKLLNSFAGSKISITEASL